MSQKISKKAITLTRGDTLRVKVDILKDDEEYTPVDGDVVRFALKHPDLLNDKSDYQDTTPLILKTIPNDTLILTLDPTDTKSLGFGEYVYDIQITFSDGTVDTFITAAKFTLTEEVD